MADERSTQTAELSGEAAATSERASGARPSAARLVGPGEFEPERHYYPRVLNAQIHPTVAYFFSLTRARLIARYCHMNPRASAEQLRELLSYSPRFFYWAGADLFHVATAAGARQMVVIETNSCPSGQKSMPLFYDTQEDGGYRVLVEKSLLPLIQGKRLPPGALAVVYDKNQMENSGYAAAIADCTSEPVYLVRFKDGDPDPPVRFVDGMMEVRDEQGCWNPIRAAFRYVTQRPWNRIPITTKTLIFNPTLACVAGGRNKALAAKAYDWFNAELAGSGLGILTPQTFWDVGHHEIPLWVRRLGGLAVVKIPYSNAGQGVFTITSDDELEAFMERTQHYRQFIVQSLIGNHSWIPRRQGRGRYYHVATVPNKKGLSFVADLRVMVCSGTDGFRPLAIYARRARSALAERLEPGRDSWDMLGTNLSIRGENGDWQTETERLLLMDRRDFDRLGIGLDDLIDAYLQTVLAAIAIDKLAQMLTTQKGKFRMKLFRSINDDPSLIDEVLP